MNKEAIELLEEAITHAAMIQSNPRKHDLVIRRAEILAGSCGKHGILHKALTLFKQQPKPLDYAINCGAMGKGDDSCCGCIVWTDDGKLLCNECGTEYGLVVKRPPALNSCPYPPCKGEGKLQKNAEINYVYCKNCGRHTDSFETSIDAIKAWNNTNKKDIAKAAIAKATPKEKEKKRGGCNPER